MVGPNIEIIRDTIKALDLALSGLPADVEIKDDTQFAFGVLDGARVALIGFEQPDLTVGELFDNHIEGDLVRILNDQDRALGMLAGSLAVTSLLGKYQVKSDSA